MDLTTLTISGTANGLAKGEFSAVDVLSAYLDRIAKLNSKLNAYLAVAKESALMEAKKADERRAAGEKSVLLGVPIALKDNITTVGIRTTAASKILENYSPSYDATVARKLKEAGAIILGKTNLDEFAHGASTENSAFGVTKNPWDTERVPGGSSGGSAAAVAADLCTAALGSDTGGSIRCPAAFCGVVGLKPSYGRVSRSGLLSMTSSTDVIGPMTKTVKDMAILLKSIAGVNPKDQTTYPEKPEDYAAALKRSDLKGLTFGLPREFMEEGLTEGVRKLVEDSVKRIESLGGKVKGIALPHTKYAVAAYYVITPSEISANLARYDGIRFGYQSKETKTLFEVYAKSRGEGFGPEAKRRVMLGTYTLSHGYYDAYYLQAQRVRTIIAREMETVLKGVDALVGPVEPHVAFKIGSYVGDPVKMYLEDAYLSSASLAGLPALSLPIGFAKPEDGETEMPVGLQIIGRRFDEATVLGIGNVLESDLGIYSEKPKNLL